MSDPDNNTNREHESHETKRLESLLRMSRSVQDMEHPRDFEQVVRVLFEELRTIGLTITGLVIQRLVDKDSRTFELYEMLPGEKYRTRVVVREPTFAEWQQGQIVHYKDVSDPELRAQLEPRYESAYASFGIEVLSILHIPNSHGVFTLRSDRAYAFNDRDVGFLRTVADFLSVGTVRVADIEELARARDAAEAAVRAKDAFLANMSHELRTPLNAVTGMARVLAESGLNDTQLEYARTIEDGGQLLLALINGVLDFARLQASGIELTQAVFDPEALIRQASKLLAHSASSKGLVLTVNIEESVPRTLVGDEDRIRQILINLVSNAIKFTSEGTVTITAEAVPAAETHTVTFVLTVHDTGIGIPEDKQDLLFRRFSQVDGSVTRAFGGSGLGLAICRELTTLMGGTVSLESAAGQGATFRVELPLEVAPSSTGVRIPEQTGDTETDTPLHTPPERTLRVLLAEDVRSNQIFVEAVLTRKGISVTSVDNGQEALNTVKTGTYDLIFMDMHMPVMDGLTATRHIRTWENSLSRQQTPIIALTASGYRDDEIACREAGMDGYLLKPFSPEALEQTIAKTLSATAASAAEHDPAPEPDLVLFDGERFQHRMMGDAELAEMIVHEFYRTALEYTNEAVRCFRQGHTDETIRAVHKLAGASGTVYALRLNSLCRELETLLKEARLEEAGAVLNSLSDVVPDTLSSMARSTGYPLEPEI
ncbi:MAG: response regulator [Spirochaetaceae bacterium]|nr:MAG: response regulator [Spirochaetaceae bacterium]